MVRIAVALGEDFEDAEFSAPQQYLGNDGHERTVFGSNEGQTVHGNLITSRKPDDLNAFCEVFAERLSWKSVKLWIRFPARPATNPIG